ncbi:MAG: alpha/beta fold hydrolase [Chitinophagaceae bacterium]
MQKTTARKLRRWFGLLLIVYIAGGLVLYFFQDNILFHPKALPADHVFRFDVPFREINLPVAPEKNLNIVQFTVPDSLCRGVVLYFHGNRRNIERYARFAPYFTRHGYEVWMMDYPGFGKSTGKCTEAIMQADALELYKMAAARFAADSIILYGKSLGTGMAAKVASMRDCRRLILETPYYDLPSVVRHYAPVYPVSRLLHYEFPIHDYLQRAHVPITIFHGTKDKTITMANAKKLLPLLQQDDEFITIEGGRHNDLYQFPVTIHKLDSLLAR